MLAFRQLEDVEDELRVKVAAEADKEERRRVAAETAAELKRGYTYVKGWLDAIYDDLEVTHLKDAPCQNPDKGNVTYAEQTRRTMRSLSASARRKAMKGVKLVQSAFAAMKMSGADLCKVNDELLARQGIDPITRKIVLRHIELLIGAPPWEDEERKKDKREEEERNSSADGTVADKQASIEVSGEWSVCPQERLPRLQGLFERRTAHKVTTQLLSEPPEGQTGRQVVVTGFERDRTSLEHLFQGFGQIESISICKKQEIDLGKDHIDVNTFLGRRAEHPRGTRHVDVIASSESRRKQRASSSMLGLVQELKLDHQQYVEEKAFCSCTSIVLKHLSAEDKQQLIKKSHHINLDPGEELILEGSSIKWLFIVVSGVYQLFATVLQKEMVFGSINGSGQLLGERDFLRRQHARTLVGEDGNDVKHSITVLADDGCSVVAVPVEDLDEYLAKTDFEADVQQLFDARAALTEIINNGKGHIISLLSEEELEFLVDVGGIVNYDEGDTIHDRPELTECALAIVIEGEVEVKRHSIPSIKQTSSMPELEAEGLARDVTQTLYPGDELCDIVHACQELWRSKSTPAEKYTVVAVERTKIMYFGIENIRPILKINFALRNFMEKVLHDVAHPQGEYYFFFFPWSMSMEWRVYTLGTARRVLQASWNDVQDAEEQVWWNRTAEKSAEQDFASVLSDSVVTLTFRTSNQAMSAVQHLEKKWSGRFAIAQLAGAQSTYSALVRNILLKIRACVASGRPSKQEAALDEIQDEIAAQGLDYDRHLWAELLRGFTTCRPVPISKVMVVLRKLTWDDGLDSDLLLDTVDELCRTGHTRRTAEFLDVYANEKGSEGVPAGAHRSIIMGWIQERDAHMALLSLSSMWSLGIVPDLPLVHLVMALLTYARCVEEAVQVLNEMEACALDEGPSPTKQTFLLLMSGLAMIADGDGIVLLIKRMQQRLQQPPDTISLNFMVEALCIAEQVGRAEETVDSMHAVWGCTPDEDTYCILAAGLVMAGEHEKAGSLLLTAGSLGYDSRKIDLHEIVLSWKQGRWRQAKAFEVELPPVNRTNAHGNADASFSSDCLLQKPSERSQVSGNTSESDRISSNFSKGTSIGTYNSTKPELLLSSGAIQEAMASELGENRRRYAENETKASRLFVATARSRGSIFREFVDTSSASRKPSSSVRSSLNSLRAEPRHRRSGTQQTAAITISTKDKNHAAFLLRYSPLIGSTRPNKRKPKTDKLDETGS